MFQKIHQLQANQHLLIGHPNSPPHTCPHTHSSSSSNYVHVAPGVDSVQLFTSSRTKQVSLQLWLGVLLSVPWNLASRLVWQFSTKLTSSENSGLSTQANFHFFPLKLAYCAQVLLYPDPCVSKEVLLWFLTQWLAGKRYLARIG